MLKNFTLLVAIIFAGNSFVGAAETSHTINAPASIVPVSPVIPTPTPNPIPSPSVEPTIVIIDGKLVKASDVLNPVVKITGAESPIDLGDLVFLECKVDNSLPQFIKASSYKWTIEGKNARGTSTNQVFFGAGIKNTTVKAHVDIALSYQVDTELVIKTVSGDVNVQIGDDTPTPPRPAPDPTPTPTPPAPTLTDNQKAIYDIAQNTFGKTLSPEDFKKAALILSTDFANCAANIGKNQYASFKEFSDDLRATNQASVALLKLDLSKFDGFRTSLHDWIVTYYNAHGTPGQSPGLAVNGDSSIKTLQDWVGIINDMAVGLKAAGN